MKQIIIVITNLLVYYNVNNGETNWTLCSASVFDNNLIIELNYFNISPTLIRMFFLILNNSFINTEY